MRAPFVTTMLPVGKKNTIGFKTSKEDVESVKRVVRRIEKEGVENVEITFEEAKALYKVLYGKYNFTTPDLNFANWYEKQKNWTTEQRNRIFADARELIRGDAIKSATVVIVILSCVVVFTTMVVATLVSSISPFTRVNLLTAKCG